MSEVKTAGNLATPVVVPPNVRVGEGSVLIGEQVFRRFFSERDPAIVIGAHCHLEGVQLALGKRATLTVGDYVFTAHMIVLSEQEVRIGNYVFASFNVVIADTDFHPIEPAQRLLDAIAVSPLSRGRPRPAIGTAPVIIEDDVWIGPNATILKGVRVGAGAIIEPGALVTRDVPPRARVLGNPAQIVGEV
jgi:acetyltransferase-like isoleucine patch superfamily enzyme